MTTEVDDDGHSNDAHHCPRCRMRAQITDSISQPSGGPRMLILDQLLDAVAKVRAVDAADGNEFVDAVEDAVDEAVALVDLLVGSGSDDDE